MPADVITPDCLALEKALDDNPQDWELRLILADAWEENGRLDLAIFFRFTVAQRRCPKRCEWGPGGFSLPRISEKGPSWEWYSSVKANGRLERYSSDPAHLGCFWSAVMRRVPESGGTQYSFPTRTDAERAFMAALEDTRAATEGKIPA